MEDRPFVDANTRLAGLNTGNTIHLRTVASRRISAAQQAINSRRKYYGEIGETPPKPRLVSLTSTGTPAPVLPTTTDFATPKLNDPGHAKDEPERGVSDDITGEPDRWKTNRSGKKRKLCPTQHWLLKGPGLGHLYF